jgi:uncharacterized protein (DUF1015 family)
VKEDDRVCQIDQLRAQTGPVLLAYPSSKDIDDIIASETLSAPEQHVTASDGVQHEIWTLSCQEKIAILVALFDDLPALYIADGHHRSAAASRVQKLMRGRAEDRFCRNRKLRLFLGGCISAGSNENSCI